MDVLTEALRHVRFRNQIYGRLELTAPWGMRIGTACRLKFYVIARGSCVFESKQHRFALAAGDLVLVRAGLPHTLKDRAGTRAVSLEEVYAQRGGRCGGIVYYGGGGAPTTLVTGGFSLDTTSLDPLAACLPDVLHVPGDGPSMRWLESTLQLLASEMQAEDPGYEMVASRLADVLFIHALRAYVAARPCESGGWLRAIVDRDLGAVLQRMHAAPEQPWTVDALARAAGMSRSAFAARFKAMLGFGPLTYLARWRMHRAAELLATSDAPAAAIASAVGYETEGAFGKTFKRYVGETPGSYRRRVRAVEA